MIPVELLYFWIYFDATCGMDALVCWCLPRSLPRCVLVCVNALGRLLFIGVWGKVNDTWQSLIGDMCHSLIGGALRLFLQDTWHLLIGRNVLIFKVTHVSTRLDYLCYCLHTSSDCLCHCLHMPMCDWVLHASYAFI